MNGPGTLVLSAVDTYTGPTTVTVGTLAVTGLDPRIRSRRCRTAARSRAQERSAVSWRRSGGTVAPGALTPFTTLNVTGNASFAPGSTFLVNINAAGQNDKLLVTGTATLDGRHRASASRDRQFLAVNPLHPFDREWRRLRHLRATHHEHEPRLLATGADRRCQ